MDGESYDYKSSKSMYANIDLTDDGNVAVTIRLFG